MNFQESLLQVSNFQPDKIDEECQHSNEKELK